MGDTTNLEALFLENLPLIDRLASVVARRNGIVGEDAADFASWVKLRIVQDDYAVLQKFRGESAIGTYLTVVVAMLARDYRVQRSGRWRPSVAARHIGPVGVKLEALVRRQGFRLSHAAEMLRTSGETDLSDRQLAALLARMPMRTPLRPIDAGAEPLAFVEANTNSDVLVMTDEAENERRRAWDVLTRALEHHSVEDRLILHMRFWDELSVADIARALTLEQKQLYKRIDRLLVELRRRLSAGGVTRDRCQELLSEMDA